MENYPNDFQNNQNDERNINQMQYDKKPKKNKNGFKVLSACLAVAIVAGSGACYYQFSNMDSKYKNEINNLSSNYSEQINDLKSSIDEIKTSGGNSSTPMSYTNNGEGLSLVEIAAKVKPSVVCITVTVPSQQMSNGFYRYETQSQDVEGSGIIISADGYIATNEHVISYAKEYSNAVITVTLDNGQEYTAKYIGSDKQNDLAVIKIEGEDFPSATLGSSGSLQVGETAVAIGNPLGIEFAGSVTVGVISALNRVVSEENTAGTMIQTDAAINPGNSGGALVNGMGEVIGINSSKISSTEVEGLGFAIPIDYAKPILESIIENGYVKGRPTIGISGEQISKNIAAYYRLPQGVLVTEVSENGGADLAGIQQNDIITTFDSQTVTTMSQIEEIKQKHSIGDKIEVSYYRNGKTYTATIVVMEDKGD